MNRVALNSRRQRHAEVGRRFVGGAAGVDQSTTPIREDGSSTTPADTPLVQGGQGRDASDVNAAAGILAGVALSIPIWVAIALVIRSCSH